MVLSHEAVDEWVNNFNAKGARVFWRGWDLIIATKNPGAFFKSDGVMLDGEWYRTFTIKPDSNGLWRIPRKYAKR